MTRSTKTCRTFNKRDARGRIVKNSGTDISATNMQNEKLMSGKTAKNNASGVSDIAWNTSTTGMFDVLLGDPDRTIRTNNGVTMLNSAAAIAAG
jgi:hypothetical protein